MTYKGRDVFTLAGLRVFNDDHNKAVGYLFHLAFGAPDLPIDEAVDLGWAVESGRR
jgi:hypothetical protein